MSKVCEHIQRFLGLSRTGEAWAGGKRTVSELAVARGV
jgi:hypothetical protein